MSGSGGVRTLTFSILKKGSGDLDLFYTRLSLQDINTMID